jgi:hypothetical protein
MVTLDDPDTPTAIASSEVEPTSFTNQLTMRFEDGRLLCQNDFCCTGMADLT